MRIIRRKPATVGVAGLGRRGLPLALALARTGLLTTGLDTDRAKVAALRVGKPYLPTVRPDDLHTVADWFEPTTDPSLLTGLDAYVITTPAAADTVAPLITRGALVVLRPGVDTARLNEGSGLHAGSDFHVTTSHDLTSATVSALRLSSLAPAA